MTAMDSTSSTSASQNHVLSEKVMQTLNIPTDTPAMQTAWAALASISAWHNNGNQVDASVETQGIDAKTVRTAMEMDALHQALAFQSQLETLVHQVRHMKEEIQTVGAMATQILITFTDPTFKRELEHEQQVAQSIATAFARRDQAKAYHGTLVDFFSKFDLTAEEGLLLDNFTLSDWMTPTNKSDKNPMEDLQILTRGMEFLQALDKIQDIRGQLMQRLQQDQNLEQMELSIESSWDSTSTLRMMKSFISRQEKAYQRLYESLSSLLDTNTTSSSILKDHFFAHPFFPRALSILHRDTPAYYTHIVDLFSNTRRAIVTRDFLIALTTGNPLDATKAISAPLERMAHDPVNYIGDMLAHIYQCLSDESDLARSCLFSFTNKNHGDGGYDYPNKVEGDVAKVLNHIVGGIVRPLRGRISAVLVSLARRPAQEDEEDADYSDEEGDWMGDTMGPNGNLSDGAHASYIRRLGSLYSICGLLIFYYEKIRSSLGEKDTKRDILHPNSEELGDYTLIRGVLDSLTEAVDAFSVSLRVYMPILEKVHNHAISNVQTQSLAQHAHDLIRILCTVHNSSPGFAVDFGHVITDNSAISLTNIGEMIIGSILSSCDQVDDMSTLSSLLGELTRAGVPHDQIALWESDISAKQHTLIELLISKETLLVLDRVGLGDVIRTIGSIDDESFSPEYTTLSPQRIQSSLTVFYDALRSSPIPTYEELITDLKLRKYARSMIADGVARAYARLHMFISRHLSEMDDGSLHRYTPELVKSLLEV